MNRLRQNHWRSDPGSKSAKQEQFQPLVSCDDTERAGSMHRRTQHVYNNHKKTEKVNFLQKTPSFSFELPLYCLLKTQDRRIWVIYSAPHNYQIPQTGPKSIIF